MKRASLLGSGLAVVMSLALAGSAMAAAFTNGGFNNTGGYSVGAFVRLYAGTGTATAIPGWTVTSGNVDWIGSYWQSADADGYSLDMDGDAPGAITQTFDTTVNATYFVQFSLSGNPDPNTLCDNNPQVPDPNACYSPSDKSLQVQATGAPATTVYFNTGTEGNTESNMMWEVEGYSFVATGPSTTLTFTSTTPGAFGPALDNVTVTQEATATGAQCKDGGWQSMVNPDTLVAFKNQGACVSYYAVSGQVPIGN